LALDINKADMPGEWWRVESVSRFREESRQFTALIDAYLSYPPPELLRRAHALLPSLYAAAIALPEKPEEAFDDVPEAYEIPQQDPAEQQRRSNRWRSLYDGLSEHVGPEWNRYREVFDPYEQPAEDPVTGSLADDLTDIYLDLARGEALWGEGDPDAAVWHWQYLFQQHWGEHATGALRALHALSQKDVLRVPGS
jgi:hypothetical protein